MLGNGIHGALMSSVHMGVKGTNDVLMVEVVVADFNRNGVHGIGHALGVVNLVSGVAHWGDVNVTLVADIVIATSNANVGYGNAPIGTLKSALSTVDLDVAWGFLIGGVAQVAPFLEVSAFVCSQVSIDDEALCELCGPIWNVIDWFVQSIGVGSLHQCKAPDTVGGCG